ncbi:RICIN domain-containing protein [Glycomyces buryatensis]|uniref:Glycosyl hydrolase family 5 n=1 Tax=Glycomyces buryatensis TaxID=2570927 RepID=A0A4S8QCM1_9ACTN|nr:RICIN domain-containing protein [Glycomyces buryatensis]THV42050.1 glycosyl hydrolase family 5 [Glycomyces buryatensis]
MPTISPTASPPPRSRSLRRLIVGVISAIALVPTVILASASPAAADTSQFRGVNWAVLGDNFVEGPLVLDKLSQSDSYDTVVAKANALYDGFEETLGVNTVRLPVNTHTVGTSWWDAYSGTIDAATDRGFKVILAYWEDGAASGGRITDMNAFNSMWDTVVAEYGSNDLVYFEPMNEPHGYSASDWANVAAAWLSARPSVPKGRILIGGAGYSQDVKPICADSRLAGTLLSYHHYAFFYGEKDYAGWVQSFRDGLGSCASRSVLTEFGAPMNNGLNYADPGSSENFVRYIRAVTDTQRELGMGSTYWPALGGKTGSIGYDWYSMYSVSGSGTDLSVSIRNPSGADRIMHGWGDGGSATGAVTLTARHSAKCADVVSASSANGAEIAQYNCNGRDNQRWQFEDLGNGYFRIIARHSGKCLDVDAASTANSARVIQWTCNGGQNQQWQVQDAGGGYVYLVARHSGKCLDVPGRATADGTRLTQYTCNGGQNQQFARST